MPTPRLAALASVLVAACSAPARTTIVVEPGVELICTARTAGAYAPGAPDASAAAVLDASVAAVDVATVAVDAPPPAPPVDPSRLALLPAERSWSVGRLARCEGARAIVVLADGTVVTRAVATLRGPRLPQGAEVIALWGEGAGEPYHAVVLDADGAGARLRYDDGTEERLPIARIREVLRGADPGPATGACSPPAGALAHVLVPGAAWRRVAVVVEAGGPSVLIETARDGRATVPAASLSRLTLATGDRVMVRWRDGTDYPARVDRAEGAAVAVTYDEGSEETIHPSQVRSWSAAQGATRAMTPYAPPAQ